MTAGGEAALFIAECDEVLALLEDLPERAEDFGQSVGEKLEAMSAWACEHEHATDNMWEAVANMRAGVEKWLEQ